MRKNTVRIPTLEVSSMLQTALILFAVVAVVGIGLTIISRMRRSLQNPDQSDKPQTLAENFRQALENGEISEAEYDRIIAKLGLKPLSKLKPPPKPAQDPEL